MTAPIRVASVPADHPYIAHLSWDETDVVRLPDPPVIAPDGTTRWWPPRMLDAGWLRENAEEFDLLHVHFGFESFTPQQLDDVVRTLRDLRKPLILTVHDLRNPHIADEQHQLDRLDVLVPAAQQVITLTPGAAQVIQERWGRSAHVIPHPHIVPLEQLPYPRTGHFGKPRIGLHLKSLRTNVDAVGALNGLALAASKYDIRPVVTMHREVARPEDSGYGPAVPLAQKLHAQGIIELVLHDPMDDDELFTHVASLDVSVMANMWGTHSGWIEMCHDLGVTVVAPDVGFYREQHAPVMYVLNDRVDAHDLSRAIDEALRRQTTAASCDEREQERQAVAAAHHAIYSSVK